MKMVTKFHHWSETQNYMSAFYPAISDTSIMELEHLKLREHHGRKDRKNGRVREPKYLMLFKALQTWNYHSMVH